MSVGLDWYEDPTMTLYRNHLVQFFDRVGWRAFHAERAREVPGGPFHTQLEAKAAVDGVEQ